MKAVPATSGERSRARPLHRLPLRGRCTTCKTGHTLNVHPQRGLLSAARHQASTDPDWQDEHRRWRPPVERAIGWLVAKGNRRVPYRGVIADNLWLHHRAAALNLRRVNLGLTRANGTSLARLPRIA